MRRVTYPNAPYAPARRNHSTPIIAVPRTIHRYASPLPRAACPDAIGIASWSASEVTLQKNRTLQTNPFAASLTPLTRIPPPKMASFSARTLTREDGLNDRKVGQVDVAVVVIINNRGSHLIAMSVAL